MNWRKVIAGAVTVLAVASLLGGCGSEKKEDAAEKKSITVGITPGYSEKVMEVVKAEAAKQGLTVEIKTFSDYVTPDTALAQKEIDLNSFQHEPFLMVYNKRMVPIWSVSGKPIWHRCVCIPRKSKTSRRFSLVLPLPFRMTPPMGDVLS